MEGDYMVQHHAYYWVVKNVYLCDQLITSFIQGPSFDENMASKCGWTLWLGQHLKKDGIRLSIEPTGTFVDVLVNIHVSVREQTSEQPFLFGNFQNDFSKCRSWSSPVIITNKEFQDRFVTCQKLSRFWDIRVKLMYNEKVLKGFPPMTLDLECKKEVGTDLLEYVNNQLGNIVLDNLLEELKPHQAIIHARCPYLSDILQRYEKSGNKEDKLMPTNDPEVMKSIIRYLYTGGIVSLGKPLPLGIYKCARLMKLDNLERLTLPTEAGGTTDVKYKYLDFQTDILKFEKDDKVYFNVKSSTFGHSTNGFQLSSKVADDQPVPGLSLSVKLISGNRIFAHSELSIRSKTNKVLFTDKKAGYFEKDDSLSFENFKSVEELMRKECLQGPLYLTCNITYSETEDNIDISVESSSVVTSEILSPEDVYCATLNGYSILSENLGRLLETSAFSDCIVDVNGTQFDVHEFILAARSSYLKHRLECINIQTLDSSSKKTIHIPGDIPVNSMNIIFEDIYTGSAKIPDKLTADALMPLTNILALKKLRFKCQQYE